MGKIKYGILRRLGYRTVKGKNYVDPDFGSTWTDLIMVKNHKFKCVTLRHPDDYREVIALEDYAIAHTKLPQSGKEK